MEYILETHDLTKVYGQKEAAKDVSLHIQEGQIYGLIGRNGAGKTTIMRMISGLSTPTRGSYSLFGKTGPEMRKLLRNVGVLIERPGLYPRLSAYENLKIKCLAMGLKPQGYVEELLKTVGLEESDWKKPSQSFSLGMRQRLGIGLALVGDPKLIILDEPINGLDPQGIAEVRETLAKLRQEKGITIMISSHILEELSKLADAYGVIHEGVLLDEFTLEELHRRSEQYVLLRTEDNEAAQRALAKAGFEAKPGDRDSLRITQRMEETPLMAKTIVEAGIGLRELSEHSVSLEDYYLRMTGGEHRDESL